MKQLFIFNVIIMIMIIIIIILVMGNSIETDIIILINMTITTLTYIIDILFVPMLHSSILGIDVSESPLSRVQVALPAIPRVMPDNLRFAIPSFTPVHSMCRGLLLLTARLLPPSYPPPSQLLPSLNAPHAECTSSTLYPLLAVNKSLQSSTSTSSAPVTLKAAPSTRTKIPLPTSASTSSLPASSSKDQAQISEDDSYIPRLAVVQKDRSRFQDTKPGPGFTSIGW